MPIDQWCFGFMICGYSISQQQTLNYIVPFPETITRLSWQFIAFSSHNVNMTLFDFPFDLL
jgi:hypothetical protein